MSVSKVEGERGVPSVSGSSSLQSRVSSVMAIGLMSVLGVGMLGWYYSRAITRQTRMHETAQAASKSRVDGEAPLPPIGPIDTPRVATLQRPPAGTIQLNPRAGALEPLPESLAPSEASIRTPPYQTTSGGVSPTSGPVAKTPAELALQRRLEGLPFARQVDASVTVQDSATNLSVTDSSGGLITSSQSSALAAAGWGSTAPHSSGLSTLLTPSPTPATLARVLPTQRLLLSKGAFIDCTLETAIDTSLPGMTTCVTATDTFGADGKVVLLERGTKLVGETQSQVQQGSSRVFVLWTEARTPNGVSVPLASPGTDELGRSGLSGQVNRHFWDRFGAAVLISVLDIALQSSVQSGGGAVIYNPTSSMDIPTELLKSTVNISPTVVKSQGDRIQVLVARDLDFRSVYELHVR